MYAFIETPLFSESAAFLSDDELRVAEIAIVMNPRAGAAIAGTRGARKLRVRLRRRGKSGGARIIYLDNHRTLRTGVVTAGLRQGSRG